jgi:hypothetical protein
VPSVTQLRIRFRDALKEDVPQLVEMLADDQLGATREDASQPLDARYLAMFDVISKDPNNALIVAEINSEIVGMLQMTFIPYLTHLGSWRCLIEGVRIHKRHRDKDKGWGGITEIGTVTVSRNVPGGLAGHDWTNNAQDATSSTIRTSIIVRRIR